MKKSREIAYGGVFLTTASVCTACFLMNFQNDWITLVAIFFSTIIFSKIASMGEIEKYVQKKYSRKMISRVSIIFIIVALFFLPDSLGQYTSGAGQFLGYVISFMCWIIGLLLQTMKRKTEA